MSAITFDTHEFVKTLESSGIPPAQADAIMQAQRKALSEALESQLATKADILAVRHDLYEVRSEIKLMKWMIGLAIALSTGLLALIGRISFILPH